MALAGHSADLHLADLLQANLLGRNTCRVAVMALEGRGTIYVANGAVLHATYGNLVGNEAFYGLLAADDVYFQVDTGLTTAERTIHGEWQGLILEAMRRHDEGSITRPFPAVTSEPMLDLGRLPLPRRPAEVPTRRSPLRTAALTVAGALVLAGVSAVGVLLMRQSSATASPVVATVPPSESATDAPIDAALLSQPGDAPPRLVYGEPPRALDPSAAVRPTIVCRVLIDIHGSVKDAKVFRSRLDLAAYEDAALEAVGQYRFTPATRRNKPVTVWLNLPMSFK